MTAIEQLADWVETAQERDEILAILAAAVAEEREACAKLAEQKAESDPHQCNYEGCRSLAAAIRGR